MSPTVTQSPSQQVFSASSSPSPSAGSLTLSPRPLTSSLAASQSATISPSFQVETVTVHATSTPSATWTSSPPSSTRTSRRHTFSWSLRQTPSSSAEASASMEVCDVRQSCWIVVSPAARNSSNASSPSATGIINIQPTASTTTATVATPFNSDGKATAATIGGSTAASWVAATSDVAILFSLSCGPEAGHSFRNHPLNVSSATLAVSGTGGWSASLRVVLDDNDDSTVVGDARGNFTAYWAASIAPASLANAISAHGSLFWYSARTITVSLAMRCGAAPQQQGAVNDPTTLTITVPVAAISLPTVAQAVTQAISISQWAGSVGSGTTSASVGRVVASRRLMLCSDSGLSSGGILQLSIGDTANDSSNCSELAAARGAVIGNLLFCLGLGVLVLAAGFVWARLGMESVSAVGDLRLGIERAAFPGCLYSAWNVVIAASGGGATLVLAGAFDGSSCHSVVSAGGDIVIGVALGWLLLCVAPVVAMVAASRYVISPRHMELVRKSLPTKMAPVSNPQVQVRRGLTAARRVREWVELLLFRYWRWQLHHTASSDRLPHRKLHTAERCMKGLLLEFRVVWYAAVDSGSVFVVSALGVLSGWLGIDSACRGLATTAVLLYVLQLVVCVAVRPFTTTMSFAYSCVTLAVTSLSGALQLWYVFSDSTDSDASVLTASAVCDLMVVAVGMVKMVLLDIPDTVRTIWRFLSEVSFRVRTYRQRRTTLTLESSWVVHREGDDDDKGEDNVSRSSDTDSAAEEALLLIAASPPDQLSDNSSDTTSNAKRDVIELGVTVPLELEWKQSIHTEADEDAVIPSPSQPSALPAGSSIASLEGAPTVPLLLQGTTSEPLLDDDAAAAAALLLLDVNGAAISTRPGDHILFG